MTISDWWIVGATIFAGLLAAAATWVAVVYTNKKTAENYERELERQRKDSAMAIIKPTIKASSIWGILERILFFNEWNRVLMLSNPDDGFDFYDNEEMNNQANKVFSIKNESKNEINSVKIDVCSKLTTDSSVVVEDTYTNFVKLLRSNEEIMFRIYTTRQRDILTSSETASVFRNLQDRLEGFDRIKYIQRKVGEAQAEGFMSVGYGVFDQLNNSIERISAGRSANKP